jgi:hypothetical protein
MSSKLQHKLYNHEVPPPPDSWEKIAAALDESHLSDAFPARLYHFETAPPAGLWEKIEAALSPAQQPEYPKKNKTYYYLRLAAAAVLAGFIAMTAIWYLKPDKNNTQLLNESPSVQQPVPEPPTAHEKPEEKMKETESLADAVRDDAALEASKKTFARLDLPAHKRILALNPAYLSEPVEHRRPRSHPDPGERYKDIHLTKAYPSIPFNQDPYNISGRYSMLITPDGNIIRLTKRWGSLLLCVAGEDQDEECIEQLKKWRERIAAAPVTPSSDGFLELLNLVSSLKENRP